MYVIGDAAAFPLLRRGGDLQNVQHVQHARRADPKTLTLDRSCRTFSTCSMPGARPACRSAKQRFISGRRNLRALHRCEGRRVGEGACVRA